MNKQRKTSHILNVFQYDPTTGAVTLPASLSLATPDSTDNSTKVATTAWIRAYVGSLSYATASSVETAIANLVASAPTTLNTLNELATALGNDPNFATTITTSIGTKVPQSRTITINGTAYDLSADRAWTIASGVTSFNTRTGAIVLSSADVTGALGFTPYNATNPSGYISGITSAMVTGALGYTPYNATNPAGYITSSGSITGSAMSLNGFAQQVEYTILNGPANGPVWKIRYDGATANRYVDLGFKDGNGVYYEGFKIYNNGTPTWAGSTIWHSGNLTNLNQLTNGPGYQTSAGSVNYANSAGAVAWTNVSGRPSVVSAFSNDVGYIGINNQSYFGINNTSSSSGNGISLYGSYSGGTMNYGIMFAGTPTYGTHGAVSGDWATYFMMNDDTTRGWIFRRNGAANVASISGAGHFSTSGYIRVASNNNLYLDWNYGQSIVGVYSSTRYQGVFAMGDSYKLAIDGSTTGNLYGLAWSHPNAGGVAGNLNTHGLLVMENGTFLAAISGSIRARDDMRAPIFYDSNDTGYYLDPNSTSNLYKFSGGTLSRNNLNRMHTNSPWDTRANQSAAYQNGTMGWGTYSFNSMTNWGSGFTDTWSNPGNAPGGSSHYVGLQSMHHSSENSYNFYGFQMTCAGEADNRFFWRSSWNTPRSWVEMIHSGNIGSQSVNYASSAGNADTVDGEHASNFATHRGEGRNYVEYSRYVYNNGAYSGSGWIEPSDLGVRYAASSNYSNSTGSLSGFDKNNPSFGAVYSDNWFRVYNDTGLYSQSYGGHIRRSLGSSFGNWETFGYERNGWSGFCYVHNYLLNIMSNTSGDHGFYQENGNGWTLFYNRGNNCWGIGTDNTYSGDGFRCVKYGSSQYGWTTWSDRRAKENITSITGALDKVLNMRGVYFNYISDDAKTQRVGFIAQELEQVLPEAVRYAEEIDEYNVEYAQIVSVLTEAIKEQDAKITRLEALVEQLINN